MNIEPGYEKLAEVLQEALDHSQLTKGKERHAHDGQPFEEQLMCATQRLLKDHPCGGLAYQVIKKTVESGRLLKTKGKEAAQKELQGAINYLGGMHIIYEEQGDPVLEFSTPNPDNVPNDPTPSDCPTFCSRLNSWRNEDYQQLGINCNDQKD
jgi:hypothetical protein